MNQLETGEAPEAAHGRSDLQKELAEVLRQRAAISAVLRAIANSPHDLQPIFDTILDSGRRLSRADTGALRLVEEAGFRLVAEVSPDVLEEIPPPVVHGSFHDRLIASKSPFQISDVAAHELYRAGDALAEALIKKGPTDAPPRSNAQKRRDNRIAFFWATARRAIYEERDRTGHAFRKAVAQQDQRALALLDHIQADAVGLDDPFARFAHDTSPYFLGMKRAV